MSIVAIAKAWVGKHFREGEPEQCMAFVRHVLREAKHPLANTVTQQAVDNLWTGPDLANSLAGRDLGPMVDKIADLQPGAILFWRNTYGTWDAGTITHVGIYVGNNQFVHRPTMSRPVELASLSGFWAEKFRCALLPITAKFDQKPAPAAPRKWKIFGKPGGRIVLVCNKDVTLKAGQEVELDFLTLEGAENA